MAAVMNPDATAGYGDTAWLDVLLVVEDARRAEPLARSTGRSLLVLRSPPVVDQVADVPGFVASTACSCRAFESIRIQCLVCSVTGFAS